MKQLTAIILFLLCCVAIAAQPKASKRLHDFERDTVQVQQVVVTGTRTPKTLADVPVPTRVVSRKDIERTDASDIQDLLTQELPGAEFSYAMNQQTHLNLSGFGGQGILFLVDGEQLAGETMDDVDFRRLQMSDVERIEIVKGAASALYGSSAGGGVINIITRENRLPWHLHLDGRWGRHGSQRYNALLSHARKQWNNQLAASLSDFNSYSVSSAANPQTRVYSMVYGDRVMSVKDRFTFDLTDHLKVRARAGYYLREVPRVPSEPERYRDFTAGVKAEWQPTADDHLELAYAFDQYDKSALWKNLDLDIRTYSNVQNSLRALYSHSFSSGDVLTVGGDVMRDYLMNMKIDGQTRSQHTADVFAQYDWDISPRWELVAALRYDYFSDHHLSRLTPRLSARYKPQHNISLRAGYGMGFRAPTLKEKYYEFDMSGIWIVEGNEQLKSELSHNLNASVEYTKGRYNVMAMVYYNKMKDKISTGMPYYRQQQESQLYLPYTNLPTYSVCGADVTARARWGIMTATFGYAYIRERLPKAVDGTTVNNQYIPARPHSLNISLAAEQVLRGNHTLGLNLSGRVLSDVDNEEYVDYYDISRGTTTIKYPAYTLWRLQAVAKLCDRMKLSVTIDNVLNYRPKYYYLNAPVTDGTSVMFGLGIDFQ